MMQVQLWGFDDNGKGLHQPIGASSVSGQNSYSLNVNPVAGASIDAWSKGTTIAQSNVSVVATATQLVASNTARRAITIYNNDSTVTIYVGTSGVTSTNGLPIPPKSNATFNGSAGATWYAIGTAAGQDVRILEELS